MFNLYHTVYIIYREKDCCGLTTTSLVVVAGCGDYIKTTSFCLVQKYHYEISDLKEEKKNRKI